MKPILWIVGVVLGIAVTIAVLDVARFEGEAAGVRQKVDKNVHQLGERLAQEGLALSLPYMVTTYQGKTMSQEAEWRKLSAKADRIYSSGEESPFEVLSMVSREYALGVFYKNHPDRSSADLLKARDEAWKDTGWAWLVTGSKLLYELEELGREVRRAHSQERLNDVHQRVEESIKFLKKHLEVRPPVSPKEKSV